MTPKELAEKIFLLFQMPLPSDPISEGKNGVPSTAIMHSLESLLAEALNENTMTLMESEWMANIIFDRVKEAREDWRSDPNEWPNCKKARAEALEQAAKVCNSSKVCGCGPAIRALKSPEGGTKG